MANTTYIGDKTNTFEGSLPATVFFPSLNLSDFQDQFGFKDDFSEEAVKQQMTIDRWQVHKELAPLADTYESLLALSNDKFGDDVTGAALYKQAVFCLTARNLIAVMMATDATSDASDRQEALDEKRDNLVEMYRRSIDHLLEPESGSYTFKVV